MLCLGYTALFAVYAWPWLSNAAQGVPKTLFGNQADERLIVYLLAWGAHALATEPLRLFQMPINFPAPDQLTGSEHLLSTQLLFAPVFWATGNAVLAANVSVFAFYPIGATATYWFLRVLGCAASVAFAGGIVAALGPLQVPAHLHLLQYLMVYFPLVAGTITRLRDHPSARRTIALATVCLLAFFSSYYTMVFTALVAALWACCELCRRAAGRARFVAMAAVGIGVPALLLLLFSLPYLARPQAGHAISPPASPKYATAIYQYSRTYLLSSGWHLRWLAVFGIIGLVSPSPTARSLARRGLLITLLGWLFMLGPAQFVAGREVPLPFALLAASPLKFVRYPFRFIRIVGFGGSLLIAAGLQTVVRLLPRWLGTALVLGISVVIVTNRASKLPGVRFDTIRSADQAVYDVVRQAAEADGPGPLLELPLIADVQDRGLGTKGDALVGATRHWLPLVAGHTGYQPPHRPLVDLAVRALPDGRAIQDLVDMTHVRWLLLRPPAQWPKNAERLRQRLVMAPWATRVAVVDGWVLLRVDPPPRHPQWFEAIARGWRPGQTALGTPAVPVPAADARGIVRGHLPATMLARTARWIAVTIDNTGGRTWPVARPRLFELGYPFLGIVHLRVAWRPIDAGAAATPWAYDLELPRDVPAGETIIQRIPLRAPRVPGAWGVAIAVRQRNGRGFRAPSSRSLHGRIQITTARRAGSG